MAAHGYEFYLQVLKVSLTLLLHSLVRDFQHEKTKFISPSGHVMIGLFCRY